MRGLRAFGVSLFVTLAVAACGGGASGPGPTDDGCTAESCDGACVEGECRKACETSCDCGEGERCTEDASNVSVCLPGVNDCSTEPECAARESTCNDGKDDDCDEYVDCDDSDCQGDESCAEACVPTSEKDAGKCSNGKDDDCDGNIDCNDEDCTDASVESCFGRFVSDECEQLDGSSPFPRDRLGIMVNQNEYAVSNIDGELTVDGLRFVLTIPSSSDTIELLFRDAKVGTFDVTTKANGTIETCKQCAIATTATGSYFQRMGSITISEPFPTKVGDDFSGSFVLDFDAVTGTKESGFELDTTRSCAREGYRFAGTVISGIVNASGANSSVLGEGGFAQTSGNDECGDSYCDSAIGEDIDTCALDCGCPADNLGVFCKGGYWCPANSECVSQGRCACLSTYRSNFGPIECDGDICDDTSCDPTAWTCNWVPW